MGSPDGIPGSSITLALIGAMAIAAVSLFIVQFIQIVEGGDLAIEVFVGSAPVVLGCIAMGLCYKAYARAMRKKLVVAYAVLLAPFAFSYPAWIVFLWLMFATGRYKGPMR